MNKKKSKRRIPVFSSIKKEAEFWDTHSTADYEDEFKPARVRFAKKLSEGITIRLDTDTLSKVRTEAHSKGIGATTLIRMWVVENVKR
jgi:predicted DNA binding CopG/RHH family protein